MVIQKNCDFITNAESEETSKIYFNGSGDTLTLSISGGVGEFCVEGRITSDGEWFSLAGINLSNFTPVKGAITEPGLYEFGIVGIRQLRARVISVQDKVSIFGQIISTEET